MEKENQIKAFVDCYIPTETCNLRCHYCYITLRKKFNGKIATFSHTPKEIRAAFSKDRWGGTCLINLCAGGETLLSGEVLPIVKELLAGGHYVMIVTNGTTAKRFDEISTWPTDLLKRLFIKFSYHFLEMKRLSLTDHFFANVRKMKEAGVSFTVEVTPSDELIPYIEELKKNCMCNLGALCHLTIARDDRKKGIDILSNYSWEEYKKIWGSFKSELFQFKSQLYKQKRTEFCYAGAWSYYLNLENGNLKQCNCGEVIGNIYQNVNSPIPQKPIGHFCTLPYCYNGHVYLALGDIPKVQAPTYSEERNRICEDGSEWLQPEMKEFMKGKLYRTNCTYGRLKKARIHVKQLAVRRGIRKTIIYKAYNKGKR